MSKSVLFPAIRSLGLMGSSFLIFASAYAREETGGEGQWHEMPLSFEVLSKGHLGRSGANINVWPSGRVGPIRTWDLNGDGYPDIVLNNNHDHEYEIPVSIYRNSGGLPANEKPLQLPGSGAVFIKDMDLNGDGYKDLVVVNGNNNSTSRQPSYVYWGSKEGWSENARIGLTTIGATHATIEDFNKDGYPDLFFGSAGDRPGERDSLLYWGSKDGYSVSACLRLPTSSCMDSVALDSRNTGWLDLIVAHRGFGGDQGLIVYENGPEGFSTHRKTMLGKQKAYGLALADLNGDGQKDLLVTDSSDEAATGIYWGTKEGFTAEKFEKLNIENAVKIVAGDFSKTGEKQIVVATYKDNLDRDGALNVFAKSAEGKYLLAKTIALKEPTSLSVGDVNGDGYDDLLVGQAKNEKTSSVGTKLFIGSKDGLNADNVVQYDSNDPRGVLISDLSGDGRSDVLIANSRRGTTYGENPAYIYWGGADSAYGIEHRQELPTYGNYQSATADFNDDGYPDLLLVTSGEDDPNDLLQRGSLIYWGDKDGYDPKRVTELPKLTRGFGVAIGDFNKDGRIDLAFGDLIGKRLVICYNSPEGFVEKNIQKFEGFAPLFLKVADVDNDGWLDIAVPSIMNNVVRIYRNSPQGFSDEDRQDLFMMSPTNMKFADLNKDGYLDMVVPAFWEVHSLDPHALSSIYWGGPEGYTNYHRTLLKTSGASGVAISDLNGDGHLDIVIASYHDGGKRISKSEVFWGDGKGFREDNVLSLQTYSGSGVLTLDLNQDGLTDLVFANHNKNNSHHTESFIYWNAAKGFDEANRTELPAIGPQEMTDADPGDLYTRELLEVYTSPVLPLTTPATALSLNWVSRSQPNSFVKVAMRSAATVDALEKLDWTDAGDASGQVIPTKDARFAQFRLEFRSRFGGSWPLVEKLVLKYR